MVVIDLFNLGYVYICKLVGSDRVVVGVTTNPKRQVKLLCQQLGALEVVTVIWTFNAEYIVNWIRINYSEFNIFEEYLEIDSREWFEMNSQSKNQMKYMLFFMGGVVNLAYIAVITFIFFTIFLILTY